MKYLLDTNICIGYINGRTPRTRARIIGLSVVDIAICSIVRAELFYGAAKSKQSEKTKAAQREFIDQFVSLPFDDDAAEVYAQIRANLEAAGTPVGPNDLMIAAIAIANGLTLVTANTREFDRLPGLQIEDWESDR